jgi:HAMP domain-containing protein
MFRAFRSAWVSTRVEVNGSAYTIQVARPLNEFYEALERFGFSLWLSVPAVLGLAALGGYWISCRALRAVDRITTTADSISIQNLSERMDVRDTGDGLQRLPETFNRMLASLNDSVRECSSSPRTRLTNCAHQSLSFEQRPSSRSMADARIPSITKTWLRF